jgi:Dolichyl-phosphate-mannose-protein mannosyltransferase
MSTQRRMAAWSSLDRSSRVAVVLAFLALLVGAGLRAEQAAHPSTGRQSPDERSYGLLAVQLAEHGRYGSPRQPDPWHWPPGAPLIFALAHRLAPDPASAATGDIPAAYWAQALAGTATIVAAWALARRLAGLWAAAAAAAAVAAYPSLVSFTGEQFSEPIGALTLTAAMLGLAWAWPRPGARTFLLPGALFGAAVLVRTDLLPAVAVIGVVVLVGRWLARRSWRHATAAAALFALGAAGLLGPWSALASVSTRQLVPVTTGSPAALFVGTYLPGDGTTSGAKHALAPEIARRYPEVAGQPPDKIPAGVMLNAVARRHPELSRLDAIALEARRNLVDYGLGQPAQFGGMMLRKVWRMWDRPARGADIPASTAATALHLTLISAAVLGLLAGLWRTRSHLLVAAIAVLATATALHTLTVSHPRYALPLIPTLLAAGAAAWALAVSSQQSSSTPAADPTSQRGTVASGHPAAG